MTKKDNEIKSHDKEYFYKYTSVDTAKKIFQYKSVRWSSPSLFNDPFDTQLKFNLGFDYDGIVPELISRFKKYIFEDKGTKLDKNTELYSEIQSLREFSENISEEEFSLRLENQFNNAQQGYFDMMKEIEKDFGDFLSTFKVFCLAEDFDNLLMWSHYADNHTGVVFRFSCKNVSDTFLLTANPIIYKTEMPSLSSLSEFADHVIGLKDFDSNIKFQEFVYTKSTHWSYEKEWRVWITREEYNRLDFVDIPILPEEIDGIIFGCKIKEEDKQEILDLATKNGFKLTQVLQAKKNGYRFALDFVKI